MNRSGVCEYGVGLAALQGRARAIRREGARSLRNSSASFFTVQAVLDWSLGRHAVIDR